MAGRGRDQGSVVQGRAVGARGLFQHSQGHGSFTCDRLIWGRGKGKTRGSDSTGSCKGSRPQQQGSLPRLSRVGLVVGVGHLLMTQTSSFKGCTLYCCFVIQGVTNG